jgi:hypothetical protein
MKEIGISQFEKLVMERLANPRDFAGRSLVLWNADVHPDGIAQRVIKQSCEKYEKEHPNDQVWFYWSSYEFIDDDFTKTTVLKEKMVWNENLKEYEPVFEDKRCGIFFNSGQYIPQEQDDWLKLVNTHRNRRGGVSPDCPMIFCASANAFKEEHFGPNCDIYTIQPTIEEWAKWAEPFYDAEIIKVVRAYIEKNGVILHIDYWMSIMSALDDLKKDEDCSLWQIPEGEVSLRVRGTVGVGHPAPDFCKFIHPFFENNSKNE